MRKLIALLLLLLPSSVWSATYYVNATGGNDSRDTTQAQNSGTPWLTIQKCANSVSAGDTCSVASGTYNEWVTVTANGSSGNLITFVSSTNRAAHVRGFTIDGQYVKVDGFYVEYAGDTCTNIPSNDCKPGIEVKKSYAQVVNNAVYNVRGMPGIGTEPGYLTAPAWTNRPNNVTVTGNLVTHSQYGIIAYGDSWLIDNNEVNQLHLYTFESGTDCDYTRAWGNNVTMSNNFFHGATQTEFDAGCHVDCIQTFGGGAAGYLADFTYNRNWCSGMSETMLEGHSGALSIRHTYSNSVFADGLNSGAGMGVNAEDVDYVTITNNTFFNVSAAAMYDATATAIHGLMRNNIVSLSSPGTYIFQFWDATNTEDHNFGYKPGGTAYCDCNYGDSSIFHATDIKNVDPKFVNSSNLLGADGIPFTTDDGLILQSDSPAIGAGYGGLDMGAYQYSTSSSVPVLVTPIDNETAGWPVDFTWQLFTGAVLFHIQVDDNSNFSSPEIDDATIDPDNACDTECHYIVGQGEELANGTHYYWRVRALR